MRESFVSTIDIRGQLIGLEGKVSAKVSPLIKVNKAIDNRMTKSTIFIQNSFLFVSILFFNLLKRSILSS